LLALEGTRPRSYLAGVLWSESSDQHARIHPETGDAVLFVNRAYTTRVDGLDEGANASLLDYLFSQVSVPEVQCRIRWKPDTVVFWDNRMVQHYATGDYLPAQRIMERVVIAGDDVVGPLPNTQPD